MSTKLQLTARLLFCSCLPVVDDGSIVPAWTSADVVQTPKEVYEHFVASGFRVKYARIPISPEQRPEDKYLDEFVSIVRRAKTSDALVFNCGMGVGRSKSDGSASYHSFDI
jgi:hypothetical protein